MEITLSKPLPPIGSSQSSINLVIHGVADKPLPPTPQSSSSTYSMQFEEVKPANDSSLANGSLPSQLIFQQKAYRASTSGVPDITPSRPKLAQDPQVHALSDPILDMRQGNRQDFKKVNVLRSQSPTSRMQPNFSTPTKTYHRQVESKYATTDSDQHASNYTAVLHTHSSNLPALTCEPYSNYSYLPSRMSSRITNVIDPSLLPPPLSCSGQEEKSRPSSHFSSSSSEMEGYSNGVRNSIRMYARKAFHLDKKNHNKTHSGTSAMQLTSNSDPRQPSTAGTTFDQQGLSNMYDTLANLSIQPNKPKPTPTLSPSIDILQANKIRVPREVRSPAIPITPYQKLGRLSWEKRSKASTRLKSFEPKSGRTGDFSTTHGDGIDALRQNIAAAIKPVSLRSRIASAFHFGTVHVETAVGLNKVKIKRTKSERRREALRKKIVLIGLDNHHPGGADNYDWV